MEEAGDGDALLADFERMITLGEQMTDAEQRALEEWEAVHLTGEDAMATSDWPGWQQVFKRLSH